MADLTGLSVSISPILTLVSILASFAGGALFKTHKAIDKETEDLCTRLTEDNKAFSQLLDSKKKESAECNFNNIQLTRENNRQLGIIQGYESILQNRNPELEKDLQAMYQFITDARVALNIPDATHTGEVRI